MSLLLDALRKAEEQKRRMSGANGGEHAPAPVGGLELEPLAPKEEASAVVSPPPSGQESLPELPSRLEDLDAQFLAHAAQAPPKARFAAVPPSPTVPAMEAAAPKAAMPPPRVDPPMSAAVAGDAAARAGARQMFAAKEAVAQPPDRRAFALAVGAFSLVAVLAIGGWFWWQLQPKGGLAPPPSAAAPVAPPPAAPAPASIAVAAPETIAVPPASTLGTAPPPEDEEAPPAPPRNEPRPFAPPLQAAARAESPIRVAAALKVVDTTFEQAWEAFNRGEFELARQIWRKALASDPRNRHALHGMAALAMQAKRPDEAAEYYLRAFEADPKDALALAGLASLRAPVDATQAESRLKTLLAEQPESPYLHFALGNLYARAARWAEAQQAFFRAHVADPANPDYLFNLAVSLDQLRQPRLAAEHYRRALAAAQQRPAAFDPAQAERRLNDLTSE